MQAAEQTVSMVITVGIAKEPNVKIMLYIDEPHELANVTARNYERVALAIARRRLDANVFPIDIKRNVRNSKGN